MVWNSPRTIKLTSFQYVAVLATLIQQIVTIVRLQKKRLLLEQQNSFSPSSSPQTKPTETSSSIQPVSIPQDSPKLSANNTSASTSGTIDKSKLDRDEHFARLTLAKSVFDTVRHLFSSVPVLLRANRSISMRSLCRRPYHVFSMSAGLCHDSAGPKILQI
jgi:AraC-like DNA-binding protein